MKYDFTACVLLNTRMAARAVSRRYDRKLRPYGITAAQFGVLGVLADLETGSVTEIAVRLAMDRTTASRNLDLLERKGLVRSESAESGNRRMCGLTSRGRSLLDELAPKWREAQDELRQELTGHDLNRTLTTLRALAEV
jgi:DNA-binding MarR family transcriptional regulator